MSGGVDSLGEIVAGIGVRERAATAPGWDKRPGALEATVCAPFPAREGPPVVVCGARDGQSWMVCAIIGGFRVTMPPAAARALAGELVTYAELAERGTPPPPSGRSPSPFRGGSR